jgi:signal transduction histidine kinase
MIAMRESLSIVLAVIVALPLALLSWLGVKVIRDERAVVKQQVQALHEERLRDLEVGISARVSQIEAELERVTESSKADPEKLRELVRSQPLVVQAFALSADGVLLHPKASDDLSTDERAFLERTRSIWSGRAMLYEPPKAEDRGLSRSARSSPGDSVASHATRRERGWIAWYWEEGLHLLWWSRSASGVIVGAEVGRVALIGRILGDLPELDPGEGRVALLDSKGDTVFQWGQREPVKSELPIAKLALEYPLDSFTLAYFAAPGSEALAGSLGLGIGASFAAVALIVIALAVYFHREQSRAMRDARSRVTFVTQVSHELKTPLTNIRLYAELLEQDLDAEDPSARHLGVIVSESQRLSRLINNILTFSKQQRDAIELRKSKVEIDSVLDGVIEQFRPSLAAKGISAETNKAAPAPIVADPDAVGQILGNLLSNVEKYASGGRVLVESAQDSAWTYVRVRDEGPGVPAGQREKIFQPYYRLSGKLSDGVTGTGIGLTIARDLARLHGGELAMLPSDRGATFELKLPRREEARG